MKTSVVIPTYNERENISVMIEGIFEALPETEVIVVDDDSPDGTSQEVASRWGDDPRVRLITRTTERGLPSAIGAGIAAATGDRIAWLDADFNMEPSFLPVLFEHLDHADLAVASRYVPGGEDARAERLRVWGSVAANVVARAVLSRGVRDYTSGLMAVRREAFEKVPFRGDYAHGDYCIDLLYRAHRAGLRIDEIAFSCGDRRAGETKTAETWTAFFVLGFAYLGTILKLRFRPQP